MEKYQVVIIGGGATGTGILRDLALRGISCLLVEQEDLAHGTSSRFHGLLHSGGRYAVKDMEAARECKEENLIIQKIAPNCIEPTGGFFVQHPDDDSKYVEQWVKACIAAGIEIEEKSVHELIKVNPTISKDIKRVFLVPDGIVDGFRIVWGNVDSARRNGGHILTYTNVSAIFQNNGRVNGVELTNKFTGLKKYVSCDVLINAAGPWGGNVAELAGIEVNVIKDKGTLIAFNQRLVNQVVNRLRPPSDGDILVPHGTITILGTTSSTVEKANDTTCSKYEVLKLLQIGKEIIPNIENFRLLRAFAGVRPLYQSSNTGAGRSVTRNFTLLDHAERDGLEGFISILGGKFTTFRLMAEKTADLAAEKLGITKPCLTTSMPLVEKVDERVLERGSKVFGWVGAKKASERLGQNFEKVVEAAEIQPVSSKIFCECELVSLAEIDYVAQSGDCYTLGDVRRKTRMGMGTCQGTFCGYRTLGALSKYSRFSNNHRIYLDNFLSRRWKGMKQVLWGQQLREAQLSLGIYCAIFGMERMPDAK